MSSTNARRASRFDRWAPSTPLALLVATLAIACGIACSEPGRATDTRKSDDAAVSDAARDACAGWPMDGRQDDGGLAADPDGSIAADGGPAGFDACEDARSGITLSTLMREMVDLTHLTRLPAVPYTTHLKSSHNPRSDGAIPGDAEWHADQDYIRFTGDATETLLEVDGPGVITRIWSAGPKGILRIFIDGDPEPAVEADLAELLRGDVEPFHTPFAFVAAHGHNLYFPIAFAESCRITLTGKASDRVYYNISYRSYPAGTELESFGPDALAASQCACEHAADRLLEPTALVPRAGDQVARFELESGAGEALAAEIEAPQGGGLVRELRLTPGETSPDLLRATALVIEMDGEITVRAPLLDFFAMGFDATEVNGLPVDVNERGVLGARWPMPFERQARVWLEHAGDGELEAALVVTHGAEPFGADSLYFYAGWHAPVLEPSEPTHDKVLAEAEGEGYYVGNTLNIVNPTRKWWGEGDERVYVDGEATPSHFGTGTEDYYGYAFCANDLFSTPYIGQTASTSHESFGRVSLYRFHVLDPITFASALRFDLEVSHWGAAVDVWYDSMSVWYARPGAVISGVRATDDAFRLPALEVEPPADVAAGRYLCW